MAGSQSDSIFELLDDNDRWLIRMSDSGQYVFTRYPDMSEEMKDVVIDFYLKASNSNNRETITDFLNFKVDNDEFCN